MQYRHIIGVDEYPPGMQAFLDHLGVLHEKATGNLHRYSLRVISGTYTASEITDYLARGGIVIDCTGHLYGAFTGEKISTSFVTSRSMETEVNSVEQIDFFHFLRYAGSSFSPRIHSGGGILAFWGIPFHLFLSTRSFYKAFFFREDPLPNEEVSFVSKGQIARLFLFFLRTLTIEAGRPLIQKSPYPNHTPPLLFRMDTDYASQKDIESWQACARDIRTTWFVHTQAQKNILPLFRKNPGDAVEFHCRFHRARPVIHDMQHGLKTLHDAGFTPRGYAAPYGIYSWKRNRFLQRQGICFGSDFSFLYDSLPAVFDDDLIQIPVHPVCMGSFLSYKADPHTIYNYFVFRITLHLSLGLPVSLYNHPGSGLDHLQKEIIHYALKCGARSTTYGEYCDFLMQRHRADVTIYSDRIKNPSRIPLRIFWGNRKYDTFGDGETVFSSKKKALPIENTPVQEHLLRRISPRQIKNMMLTKFFWRN
jgi:hypothetical protein